MTMKIALPALGFLAAIATWLPTNAKPIAQATIRDIVVVLTDEPCAMRDVIDMDYRGTWDQGTKHYEGCWGVNHIGIVIMYFDDKSFAAFPPGSFRKIEKI